MLNFEVYGYATIHQDSNCEGANCIRHVCDHRCLSKISKVCGARVTSAFSSGFRAEQALERTFENGGCRGQSRPSQLLAIRMVFVLATLSSVLSAGLEMLVESHLTLGARLHGGSRRTLACAKANAGIAVALEFVDGTGTAPGERKVLP